MILANSSIRKEKPRCPPSPTETAPAGTWSADPVHSHVSFEIAYAGTNTFRGGFHEYTATLEDGVLEGAAQVASVDVKDEQLNGHLHTPDFFDAERFPEISFRTTDLEHGELTIKGVTRPVTIAASVSRAERRSLRPRARRHHARGERRPQRVRRQLERAEPGRRQLPRRRRHHQGRPGARAGRRADDADPRRLRQPAGKLVQHEPPAGCARGRAGRRRARALGGTRRAAALRRGPRGRRARVGAPPARGLGGRRRDPLLDSRVQRLGSGRPQERGRLGVPPEARSASCATSRSRSSARAPASSAPSGRSRT